MKRIVSMLLALVLVVGMLPMGVFAEAEEEKTPDPSASQTQTSTPEPVTQTPAPATTNTTTNTSTNTNTSTTDQDPSETNTNKATEVEQGQNTGNSPENKKSENDDKNNTSDQNVGKSDGNVTSENNSNGQNNPSTDGEPKGENTGNPTDPDKTDEEDNDPNKENEEEEEGEGNPKLRSVTKGASSTDNGDDGDEKTTIDLSGLTFTDKTYDGKTTVTIPSTSVDIPADSGITLKANTADANVGTDKPVTVTIEGDTENKYALKYPEGGLKINIVKANVNTSVNRSTTITVYKNVPNTYSIDLNSIICNSGLKGDGCALGIHWSQSKEKTDGTKLSEIFSENTGSASRSGGTLELVVSENFTIFAKNIVTYTIVSKNYNDFDFTLNFVAADLSYTVSYDLNGGTGAAPTSSTASSYNAEITLPDGTGLSRTNYKFTGWNTEKEGTGTSYNAGQSVSKLTKTNGDTVTLYAQWKPTEDNKPEVKNDDINTMLSTYNITATYKKYGDDTQNPQVYSLRSMTGYTYKVSGDDVNGYTLTITMTEEAWKSKEEEVAEIFADGDEIWKLDPTLASYTQTVVFQYNFPTGDDDEKGDDGYVPWEYVSSLLPSIYMNQYFTVKYQMDTDDSTPASLKGKYVEYTVVKNGTVPAFEETEEVKTTGFDGYTFQGWTLGGSTETTPETVTENITFTGSWKRHSLTIQFDKGADDATGNMEDKTVDYGSDATLTPCGFTRPGYRFLHWEYTIGDHTTILSDEEKCGNLTTEDGAKIILTAQWKPVVSQVNFTMSGYGYGKQVTGIGVFTSTTGVSLIGSYNDGFLVTEGSDSITSADATFGANKIYYLYVNFALDEGYEDGDLTKNTVFLNDMKAEELTGGSTSSDVSTQSINIDSGGNIEYNPGYNPESPVYTAKFQLPAIREIKVYLMTKNGTVDVTGATLSGESGVYYAMDGDKVTFKVTPAKGYVCSSFKVDGKSQTISSGKYSFNVSGNHVVKIWFAKDSGNAKTGDDVRLVYLAAAGIASLAALTALAVIGLKKKKK